jgi:hypothetical protein
VVALKNLFQLIKHPLREPTYTDPDGEVWQYPNSTDWTPPWNDALESQICIFDMDNRELGDFAPTIEGDVFNWDNVDGLAGGMLNHYLYGKHGIDLSLIYS